MSPISRRSLYFRKNAYNENIVKFLLKISFDVSLSVYLIISDIHRHFSQKISPILPSCMLFANAQLQEFTDRKHPETVFGKIAVTKR